MATQSIPVPQLLLDVQNPRLGQVQSQNDAIVEVIERQGEKLVVLARSISELGLSPLENMIVLKHRKQFIVLEGNRRITAIKLLANPDLAEGTEIEGAIKRIAKAAKVRVKAVDCVIADSREQARVWISLRHLGQAGGAGVVPWGAREATRFNTTPGSQAAKGLAFLDAVEAGYPDDLNLLDLVEIVGDGKLTTLGRLIADPDVRKHFNYSEIDGLGLFGNDADDVKPAIVAMLNDVAGKVTVSQLKNKAQRKAYIKKLPKINPKVATHEPKPLEAPVVASPTKPAATTTKRKRKKKPTPLLADVDLENLGARVKDVLGEVQTLDIEQFPNAVAIMLRALLELTVDQLHDNQGWKKNTEFKNRLRKALKLLDSTEKDPQYQNLRTGLQDGSSLYAVTTLHAYVHNPYFHPTNTELRSIAANLAPFLKSVDAVA
jgi:phosphopantetheine adenylyltransferase